MTNETQYHSPYEELFARCEAQKDAAVLEAQKLRQALEQRGIRRAQNARDIERKLYVGTRWGVILTPRKVARLEHELEFLRTYNDRHPVGEAAVQKHIWIRFGLNYESVMSLHNMARPH